LRLIEQLAELGNIISDESQNAAQKLDGDNPVRKRPV
jgi:hypothetical protein